MEDRILRGKVASLDIPYNGVGEFILKHLENEPKTIGQIDAITKEKYTFAQMRELGIRCALWLSKQGIKEGDVIALCSPNHLDTFVPFFASMFIGAVFNPIIHTMIEECLENFIELTEPKVVFASEQYYARIAEIAKGRDMKIVTFEKVPGFQSFNDVIESHDPGEIERFECASVADLDKTAMIVFSSGTTGPPKGVEVSHAALIRSVVVLQKYRKKYSVKMWYISLCSISGAIFLLNDIGSYTTRILHQKFDPEETCKIMEKYKVNCIYLMPYMLLRLYKEDIIHKYDLSSLKYFMTGGVKISKRVIYYFVDALPNASVYECYGMSETGGLITFPSDDPSKKNSVGTPAFNVQIKVIDPENGMTLGSNETGELCIKSPYMMKGYYRNEEKTKSCIDSEGWLHTEDLGYYDEEGYIFVVDRIKELLKYRGIPVSTPEIEHLLMDQPGVTEASVVGVPHEIDIEHPIAFVVKIENSDVTEDDLKNAAATLGDSRKLRAGVKFVDELPRTPSGKVDRKKLKKMASSYSVREKLEFTTETAV